MDHHLWKTLGACIVLATLSAPVRAETHLGNLTFSNSPLLRPDGSSEPAIAVDGSGHLAVTALGWLSPGTHVWTGAPGSVPSFLGVIDEGLRLRGRQVFGGADADVDLGSTGTLHATTLLTLGNPQFGPIQLGVSAIACPNATSAGFSLGDCTAQVIDRAGTDRQWITSDGSRVFISYHDAENSTLIRVQRSDDDGHTWRAVGDPIVGHGSSTAAATFNNSHGPIVADPLSHNLYTVYVAGEPGIQKATTIDFNRVFVARSEDGGKSWATNLVFSAPLFTRLNHFWPTLAVDPTNGKLYAAWSDAHHIFFSASSDRGDHWSLAVAVNIAPASTALFPWIAAYGGTVNVVYYGTSAASHEDPSAVWNVYIAQTTDDGASFAQSRVSSTPNHSGVLCSEGVACPGGTRNLLDLFEVAIDAQTGQAVVIYTDDSITVLPGGSPLPQVVFARQE